MRIKVGVYIMGVHWIPSPSGIRKCSFSVTAKRAPPPWLLENPNSVTFWEALLSLGLCKSPPKPVLRPSHQQPALDHCPSLPWRWYLCCLGAKLEHRKSLPRPEISVPGIRIPSAQPTIIPIRGPTSSTFLSVLRFLFSGELSQISPLPLLY